MSDEQFKEMEGRIDGVARVLMALIADLEIRENLDGERFCQGLRRTAEGRGKHPGLETSARVMKTIADELDDARRNRSTAHRS